MNKQNNKPYTEKQKNNQAFFAEVIQSSLNNFLAQSWKWNFFPSFGSLVQVESADENILGIVAQIQTGSMDPMRYPFPYQKTEDELIQEQPQIFEFLKTTFNVQIVGYIESNKDKKQQMSQKIFYMLPPKPCKIHAFVKQADIKLIEIFFSKSDFLHLLFSYSNNAANLDELLLSIFRQLFKLKLLTSQSLTCFCQTFSLLSGNDYRRLKLFLKRVECFKKI
ncbi:hypothetical protein GF322_03185 [Candidatus Dependentiae bacterium]|nr:hypothetical protein [Candidatus Dependentiae bacterium]